MIRSAIATMEKEREQIVAKTTQKFMQQMHCEELAEQLRHGYEEMAAINLNIANEFQKLEREVSSAG